MANIRSAKKRMRQNPKRQARNVRIRTRARTYVKLARTSIDGQDPAAATAAVKQAISELDRAASRGVIHRNNASRRKGRLMKQLAKARKGS